MCYVNARDVEHSELLIHWRHVPGHDDYHDDDGHDDYVPYDEKYWHCILSDNHVPRVPDDHTYVHILLIPVYLERKGL